jgi:predicted GTPase
VVEKQFNMDLLRESIEKGEKVLDDISGKDVVVVVGKTGVGKSTLIHGIAGKSFHVASFKTEISSQTIESQVFDADDPIPGFEIGHAKSSKTQALNVFSRKDVKAENAVVYIDTPGFEDTEGIEVDIATSIMLAQVRVDESSMVFLLEINIIFDHSRFKLTFSFTLSIQIGCKTL